MVIHFRLNKKMDCNNLKSMVVWIHILIIKQNFSSSWQFLKGMLEEINLG